jgi:hypothetical protein
MNFLLALIDRVFATFPAPRARLQPIPVRSRRR